MAGAVVVVAGIGAAPAQAAYPGTNGRIAYAGVGNIGTINATGGAREPLISQAGVNFGSPSWSADGQRIAYNSNSDGDTEIFVATAAGAGVT
jgi:Tol biopolymer transport system component